MNYRNFEKNIKDKLYHAEADLDINQFINELNTKREKTRKIPFLPFILLATVFLAAGFFLLGKYSNQLGTSTESQFSKVAKSEPINEVSTNLAIQQSQVSQPIEQKPIIDPNQNTLNPSDQIAITKTNNSSYKKFDIQSSSVSNKNLVADIEKTVSKNDKLAKNSNAFENVTPIGTQNNTTTNNIQIATNESDMPNAENSSRDSEFNGFLSDLPLKNQKLTFNHKLNIGLAYTKDVKCPSFAKKSNIQFSFIPEVGYFRPLKSLANNVGENPLVYDLRNKNEKSLEGLQAALYLQVQKKSSPLYFRAGINYAQMTEKMSLQYTYTQRDTSIGIISITVSQTGDTITTIYGEIITETQKKGTKVGHHKFQLWDIPVSIGYEKRFAGFNLGAEVGASFNVSMSASGKLLENSIGFKEIAFDSPYKSKLGINYFGSVFISKEVLENQSVYAALRGRYIPEYFTNSGAPITEKYSLVGLHIGYKINF